MKQPTLTTPLLLFFFTTTTVNAFGIPSSSSPSSTSSSSTTSSTSTNPNTVLTTRRGSIAKTASLLIGGTAAASLLQPLEKAYAIPSDETPMVTTRMGGLLERYQDVNLGISILAPSGWNKFEGEVGAYNLKWQDLVSPSENIKISSNPVKSTTTSIAALGEDVQALGESLATKRDAKLINANERFTDGVLYYEFDFAINDGTHQLLSLCVLKGKVWSLDANCTEKRYKKLKEMYYNVIGSFVPRLT